MKKFLSLVLAALLLLSGCGPVAEKKPAPAAKEAEPPKVVNLIAFGDYMVHRPQINGAKTADGFDFTGDFQYLKPYIEAADVAMINLETTLTDGAKGYTTFPLFASPIEIARDLKTVGFDVVSTANNHAYDTFGPGVETTYRALTDAGMDVVGSGENKAEPLIKTVKGMKIGFLAYTYGLNGNDGVMKNSEKPEAVAIYSEEKADEDIKALKAAGGRCHRLLYALGRGVCEGAHGGAEKTGGLPGAKGRGYYFREPSPRAAFHRLYRERRQEHLRRLFHGQFRVQSAAGVHEHIPGGNGTNGAGAIDER